MRRFLSLALCLAALSGCATLGGGGETAAPPRDRLFGEDKLKHFFTSFLVTSLSASGARAAGLDRDASLVVGAGVGTGLGLGKELLDRRDPRANASLYDFLWDVAGVGAGTAAAAQAR